MALIANTPDAFEKLKNTKLLMLDVDGVLTDGSITYSDRGEEIKTFSAKDGLGIRMLMDAGIGVCIITGRRSKALTYRCNNLGITTVYDGVTDKASVFDTIADERGVPAIETAAIGDDLPDLPLLRRAGCAISVADGHEIVRNASDIITEEKGGCGAVRAISDEILKLRGHWEAILSKWK